MKRYTTALVRMSVFLSLFPLPALSHDNNIAKRHIKTVLTCVAERFPAQMQRVRTLPLIRPLSNIEMTAHPLRCHSLCTAVAFISSPSLTNDTLASEYFVIPRFKADFSRFALVRPIHF